MKKIISLSLLVLTASFFWACDEIDPPYIEGDPTPPVDTTECPVPDFPDDTHHVKVVLLEEYTGHSCVNCPSAAKTAHDIQVSYPEELIIIAIHAGYFAQTEAPNYLLDLNTAVGTELHSDFGITNNPAAIFNRKEIGGNLIFEAPTAWEATFLSAQSDVPELDLQMIVNYDQTGNKACIHVQTEFLTDVSRNMKIAVYVTEDSIVGYQRNNNASVGTVPEITDYIFMHVLRGSVNGTWGTALNNAATTAGTKTISSFKLVPDAGWLTDRLHLVALVYDSDTDEVLQAVEKKLKP